MAEVLRARLEAILATGLSTDPLEHAEQTAQIVAILHEAFGRAGLRSTVVDLLNTDGYHANGL